MTGKIIFTRVYHQKFYAKTHVINIACECKSSHGFILSYPFSESIQRK